jgi:hypothetical protein
VSKKEIRRAAREAFPKAKNAAAAGKRSSRGAYTKRTVSGGSRSTAGGSRTASGRYVPKPPSIKRALVYGIIAALFYFVVIQWLWKSAGANTQANILFSAVGALMFTGVFYLTDRWKYRRYVRKQKDSSK